MSSIITQVRTALGNLNPNEIRQQAEKPVQVITLAESTAVYEALEAYLTPPNLTEKRRWASQQSVKRTGEEEANLISDLLLIQEGLPLPDGWSPGRNAFRFSPGKLDTLPGRVLDERSDLSMPLARRFEPFRAASIRKTVHTVSKENAVFSLMTALPNIVPSIFELPWALGEFASDTAVLTANQIRMAFLIAAASDHAVGYREQKSEIASIVAGAWGWRSIARELIGKIPLGGGLIPKAAVAYAGTYIVGQSLERFYRKGYGLTKIEKVEAYKTAYERGKEVARAILDKVKKEKS